MRAGPGPARGRRRPIASWPRCVARWCGAAVRRGRWARRTAALLGLLHTLRDPGRPRNPRGRDEREGDQNGAKVTPDELPIALSQRIGSPEL